MFSTSTIVSERERERVNETRRVLDFINFLVETKHLFKGAFCFPWIVL